jgi:hypothetical protein
MTKIPPTCLRILVLLTLFLSAPALQAHETTRSYVSLTRVEGVIDAQVRIAFRDIEVAVWMDENLDGNITWGEAKQRLDAVSAYFASVFTLDAGGPCQLARKGASVSTDTGIDYLDLDFTVDCPDPKAAITSVSHLFADIDPDHRMFLTANLDGATTTTLLSAANPDTLLNAERAGLLRSFVDYFEAGIEHLIGGGDLECHHRAHGLHTGACPFADRGGNRVSAAQFGGDRDPDRAFNRHHRHRQHPPLHPRPPRRSGSVFRHHPWLWLCLGPWGAKPGRLQPHRRLGWLQPWHRNRTNRPGADCSAAAVSRRPQQGGLVWRQRRGRADWLLLGCRAHCALRPHA